MYYEDDYKPAKEEKKNKSLFDDFLVAFGVALMMSQR